MKITKTIAKKVLAVVDEGLVYGLGNNKPGEMCVEAAVCFALGLPHSDNPPCVGVAVRSFKIRLNDSSWSSDEARAKGMRKLAVAQLGSDVIDQKEFSKRLAIKTCRRLLPHIFRIAAKKQKSPYKEELLKHAEGCEKVSTLIKEAEEAAREAARKTRSADASYAAAAAATFASATRDEILTLSADLALEVLVELKSPGCEFLNLCDL